MEDEWGRDPQVRSLRRIFGAGEAKQARPLEDLGIRPLDARLGQLRRMALHLFERSWAGAGRTGATLGEKDVADLYLHCLARVLATRGITVPGRALPDNVAVARLLEEKG